ncbi:arginyl-tRNA--protein transferase 1 isoform X2 [Scaptodrosophila lebanonensis]|uniref:Arginyl-tRNA--protein transferase 1 n=1 Tax=Drosophila lebanonensis TaxID=7225 RepID=A0A6J2TYZ5_DROLE|nr:arginyl-tRNA--protein transferase 1 isoform X2 [Scaptodrosophila lebanonensis]
MAVSIVQYFGKQNNKCGYCKELNRGRSHGMHAFRLTCEDYQELIDRGWRRCGMYCYKPQNNETCCPCYTIKCDALEFRLSKSNKRVMRRMNRFLRDGKREVNEQDNQMSTSANGGGDGGATGDNECEELIQLPNKAPVNIDVDQVAALAKAQQQHRRAEMIETLKKESSNTSGSAKISLSLSTAASNPPRKKAKQMRLERRQAKLGEAGTPKSENPKSKALTQEKSLRDFLAEPSDNNKHKLKLRLVHVDGEEFKCTLPQSYALYKKYQILIHNDTPENKNAYLEHLKVSPMKNEKSQVGPPMGYGSFHQQYWLDDKLIAVGVIDILPCSISSVYFFYDPDYSFLSLGTYGSLREIDFVQTLAKQFPDLKYYYMGFYIHSCPKMRYKGKLSASYLLCPETYEWFELTDEIRSKLDAHKYQRLNNDSTARDANEFLQEHLKSVKLLIDANHCTNYGHYVQLTGTCPDADNIMEYSQLVGKICALRMLYVNTMNTG